MQTGSELSVLGVGEFEERAYRILLRWPGLTVSGLADRIGSPAGRVRRAVARLEQTGLITRSPVPTPKKNRPSNITLAVADACAIPIGVIRCTIAVTPVPTSILSVACAMAPSVVHTNEAFAV